MYDNGVLSLCNSIIIRSVEDYTNALRRRDKQIPVLWTTDSFLEATKIYHSMTRARWDLQDLRRFFFGKWFEQLCDVDPQKIIDHIEDEYKIIKKSKKILKILDATLLTWYYVL